VGGTPPGRLAVTGTLLTVMLLVVCAIGLGWSAVTARSASSVVLTYLTVAFMGVGLPVLFLLSVPLVTEEPTQPARELFPVNDSERSLVCRAGAPEHIESVAHTERTWWLLAGNPYVILADASPKPAGYVEDPSNDPLSMIRAGARTARVGPVKADCEIGHVYADYSDVEAHRERQLDAVGASWPYGLAVNLALGVGGVVVAVRRLRAPATRLPRGTRVA
jgi:hypothetical protein